jgi:2-polyprenyl-3-methyl-5-hydroxy-6-metoxy-1,4-benzoquinol methylase
MLGSRDGLMVAGNSRFPFRRCTMAGSVETFQVSVEAAEVYESKFVPAIFGEWAPYVVDAAGVAPGQAVLDVGCGTGVVAREAADRMGGQGSVVGLDLNEGMLAVARRLRPDIEWRQGTPPRFPSRTVPSTSSCASPR